jgi:hypothetical protein
MSSMHITTERRQPSSACSIDVPLFDGIADPVFILSAPRSFSSVICAMLGQHPEMYGLPELHLLTHDTLAGWWQTSGDATFGLVHGLLRTVAEVCFGEQTERTVRQATGWLMRRSCESSGMVFEELARALSPRVLIEKSPSMVYAVESMRHVYRFFPQAKFIHLVRHPRGYCESVLKYGELLSTPEFRPAGRPQGEARTPGWIRDLACFPSPWRDTEIDAADGPTPDPQAGWYVLNTNVAAFLNSIPGDQWIRIRGEDLLGDPERRLARVAEWIGVRADVDAVQEMMHPEESPYARHGPRGAGLGNDILFLNRPAVRPGRGQRHSLDGALPWRADGAGFRAEVAALARSMGYD